jgi:transcriptional antiterminator RfaH
VTKSLEDEPEVMATPANELSWFVAHTRPRCEKKLFEYCGEKGFHAVLPCYRTAHKYRGKTVIFRKPLFPGYLFLRAGNGSRHRLMRSDYIAKLLEVLDQATLSCQIEEIMQALETDLDIRLAPAIGEGMRVKVKGGPLKGLDGWVEHRYGLDTVLLRLDFIGQAAAVKVDAMNLELI